MLPLIALCCDRNKALGDIRGASYIYGIIYGMFYRFGLIDIPEKAKTKMKPMKNAGPEKHR